MSMSTRNAPSSPPVDACIPFSGLGHSAEAVLAVARRLSPRWKVVLAVARPIPRPVMAYGYELQCRLGREARAG